MLKCKGLKILLTVCHIIVMLVGEFYLSCFPNREGHGREDYEDHDISEYKPPRKKRWFGECSILVLCNKKFISHIKFKERSAKGKNYEDMCHMEYKQSWGVLSFLRLHSTQKSLWMRLEYWRTNSAAKYFIRMRLVKGLYVTREYGQN